MLHKARAPALHKRASWHAKLPASPVPAAHSRPRMLLSLHAPCNNSRQYKCNTASADAPYISSSSSSSSSSIVSSSSMSLQLRRPFLMQQLLQGTAQQQQQGYGLDDTDETPDSTTAQTSSSSSSSSRAAGFGGKRQPKAQQQQQQQQRRSDVAPDAACPCKSGLRYKACCQPFVAAAAYPKSAPELVRARITAALAGKPDFLVSSSHPDSSAALGGRRSLASSAKRQCTQFKRNKCEVVGMAHCPGDEEGTWLVLAILQATAGEFKGEKSPYMELIARRSWNEQQQHELNAGDPVTGDSREGRNAAAAAGNADDRWMFYKQTNELPSNGGGEAIVALLQQHVPELLSGGEGDDAAGQQGVIGRQVYFNWVTPCFPVSSSSSSSSVVRGVNDGGISSSWYVDLLTPAVERLGAGTDSSSSSSRKAQASSGSSRRGVQQQLSLLPPGVFRMDDWLEQQRIKHSREDDKETTAAATRKR